MPAFIPRFAGITKPAGLYAAESENLLFDPIDQETRPIAYDYAVVPDDFGIELWARKDLLGFEIGPAMRRSWWPCAKRGASG